MDQILQQEQLKEKGQQLEESQQLEAFQQVGGWHERMHKLPASKLTAADCSGTLGNSVTCMARLLSLQLASSARWDHLQGCPCPAQSKRPALSYARKMTAALLCQGVVPNIWWPPAAGCAAGRAGEGCKSSSY